MSREQSRELFLLFRQMLRKHAALMARETGRFDLTSEQWSVLRTIHRQGSMTQKAVADKTHKDTSTLTRVLDQLEKKELITRNPHKTDRRAISLNTTEKGGAVADQMFRIEKKLGTHIMNDISAAEVESIKRMFEKIMRNMDELQEMNTSN